MMTEINKTEERLTTADMAAKSSGGPVGSRVESGVAPARPTVLRNERTDRNDWNDTPATGSRRDPEIAPSTANRQDWDNTPAAAVDQQTRDTGSGLALFSDSDMGDLRSRWNNVQTEFVDEPRHAVQQADQLVATVMQRLAEGFAKERGSLEKQWDSGENVSTEDLRMALQRYRAFFNRLLNAA